ncbi:hypothetical protein D915_009859 [Fasciola hepatica]|uniref:Uncharacterized protein n=1 Tax=Fasciola hepatica TaxID=6192 RepID=A0A4E0QVR4_FASHE|nr:hypothetical protein D915_009859 [Fasciola hepatica]
MYPERETDRRDIMTDVKTMINKSSLRRARCQDDNGMGELKRVTIMAEETAPNKTAGSLGSDQTMIKSILKSSLGLDTMTGISDIPLSTVDQRRVSSITLEMLMEREEIDVHPYGRGGIYEGILYSHKKEEELDFVVILVWLIFSSSVLMISIAVVFVAELSYYLYAEQTAEDRQAYCDFFKTCKAGTN